jgi:tripartite ATP-independent transporter DctM subunit
MLGLTMFGVALVLLLLGFRVAFVFGSVGLYFAFFTPDIGLDIFELLPHRIYGIMQNFTLMAVPLFIFMGLVLEKSGLAERMLHAIGLLFGKMRGGVAVSVVLVGAVMAATMGIVSASVVMMTLISLPVMINAHYSKSFSAGTIAAAGTLGQLIPPSIVLIILGDVMQISVGDLFHAAIWPSMILVALYLSYILGYAYINKSVAPAIETELSKRAVLKEAFFSIIPMGILILIVLGSIFMGVATPTESAAMGASGALLLSLINRHFSWELLQYASEQTVKITSMIFMILIGATAFSLVFNEAGGSDFLLELFTEDLGERWHFLLIAMLLIFVLGFFIDFIEISFIVVPMLYPIAAEFDINLLWFAILIAMNLQISFLSPPFGFSLFFLKGAANNLVNTLEIYRGVIPYILLQVVAIVIVLSFPELVIIEEEF